jgi:hypothetical protein
MSTNVAPGSIDDNTLARLRGALRPRTLTIVYGPTNCGKSALAHFLAAQVPGAVVLDDRMWRLTSRAMNETWGEALSRAIQELRGQVVAENLVGIVTANTIRDGTSLPSHAMSHAADMLIYLARFERVVEASVVKHRYGAAYSFSFTVSRRQP